MFRPLSFTAIVHNMATMAKKFIYRFLRIGQNVGPKMSSFSKNGFSIFNVTDKCCENVPGICEDLKNISELQEKIRKRGDKIDKLQLEGEWWFGEGWVGLELCLTVYWYHALKIDIFYYRIKRDKVQAVWNNHRG